MEPEESYSTHELPREWATAVIEKLKGCKLDVGRYQSTTVKERFLDAMASPNIDTLTDWAYKDQETKEAALMRDLSLDERTLQRWVSGQIMTHPRTFFGLLYIGLRREICEFNYPNGRRVVESAVFRTLQVIRWSLYGGPAGLPGRDDFLIVRQLIRHPEGECFIRGLQGGGAGEASAVCRRVLVNIIEGVDHRGPSGRIKSATALAAIRDWAIVYATFRFGLPLEMSFILGLIDDDAR